MTHHIRKSTVRMAVVLSLFAASSAWAASNLVAGDTTMLKNIAQSSMAEIATANIALEKSTSPQIKTFAQMMIDDHTKALADTKTLATAKGVDLPDGPDMLHKAAALKLRALSGDTFDASYVKQSGVADHVATEKLLKKTQTGAKDGDLKALATQMLPVVQGHLKHARELPMKK